MGCKIFYNHHANDWDVFGSLVVLHKIAAAVALLGWYLRVMPQMILQNDCTKNLFNANHPTMAISEDVSLEFSFQNVFFLQNYTSCKEPQRQFIIGLYCTHVMLVSKAFLTSSFNRSTGCCCISISPWNIKMKCRSYSNDFGISKDEYNTFPFSWHFLILRICFIFYFIFFSIFSAIIKLWVVVIFIPSLSSISFDNAIKVKKILK